ncbi:hypothetical protein [Sphingopyxis sp.]|uniref:hypothetical protein n=1 Tax=Sphingopyxis sp. TaxID=1908224 RepID=UPI002FC7F3DD
MLYRLDFATLGDTAIAQAAFRASPSTRDFIDHCPAHDEGSNFAMKPRPLGPQRARAPTAPT